MKPPSGTRALSTAFARATALSPSQILDAIGRAGAGAVVLDAQIDPVRFNALGFGRRVGDRGSASRGSRVVVDFPSRRSRVSRGAALAHDS